MSPLEQNRIGVRGRGKPPLGALQHSALPASAPPPFLFGGTPECFQADGSESWSSHKDSWSPVGISRMAFHCQHREVAANFWGHEASRKATGLIEGPHNPEQQQSWGSWKGGKGVLVQCLRAPLCTGEAGVWASQAFGGGEVAAFAHSPVISGSGGCPQCGACPHLCRQCSYHPPGGTYWGLGFEGISEEQPKNISLTARDECPDPAASPALIPTFLATPTRSLPQT